MKSKSHLEGYEYQDCLCGYFILKEILDNSKSTFKIDLKENETDKFDDLTIIRKENVSKKQIKYSNPSVNRSLSKADISTGNYDLALDTLFDAWNNYDNSDITEFRLCLAWNEPTDELKNLLLEEKNISPSFNSHNTKVFRITIEKLWPEGESPLSNWKRLRDASSQIDRNEFAKFCNQLLIEVNFPKFSQDIYKPDELEKILIEQMRNLGVGEYPNDNISIDDSLLRLFYLIRICRSQGRQLNVEEIFQYLKIRTDYGEIRQKFPINESLNVLTKSIIDEILNNFSDSNKVTLIGEPGAGKSWAVENLTRILKSNGNKIVNYYCYTSLEDELQKERIKTNTLYGSLLAEILKTFPDLEQYKELKFASNLNELNLILEKIDEDIYIIVDGLDHINRIYERVKNEVTQSEVDIINKLAKLKVGKRIKFLLVSQPIKELDELEEFKQCLIPNWTQKEIIAYLNLQNVSDIQINQKELSNHLLDKCDGNPLYLTYIVEELKYLDVIKEIHIQNLPSYSYNLKNYYGYLLSKSNLSQDVPRILAGASFRLNKEEIKQITKMGDIVDSSLTILSPILKSNYLRHGYTIYHESFRRYIIDYLEQNNVSIIDKVYDPLINWLRAQGFYSNYKSYRYFFQLLLQSDKIKEILSYLSYDFLIQSVMHGYSWQLIKNNLQYFLYSCVNEKDLPSIILLNELKHTLISTENEFEESFENYFEALGYLKGFEQAVNYLSFEDRGTLQLELGIKACYICDLQGVAPPWNLYWDYIGNKETIPLEDFKFLIRYYFINDRDRLLRIIKNLIEENRIDYLEEFKIEFESYPENNIKEELLEDEEIRSILISKKTPRLKLEELITKVLGIEHFSQDGLDLLKQFFNSVEDIIKKDGKTTLDFLIDQLKAKNWFFNWIIYYIKIIQIKHKPDYTYVELKEAFQYLIYDTEPFKGKPRTCDLYQAEEYIHFTFSTGLSFVIETEQWDEILDILLEVSNKTTTSLQRSLGGPLSTNEFFKLLEKIVQQKNIVKIISLFEKIIENEKDYNLYSYLAEYNFRLCKLYSKVNDKTSAEMSFANGIKYLLSYTFRKDSTLEELLETIEGITTLQTNLGNEYAQKIKILAETVLNHTDGKGTRHFLNSWYRKYLEIDLPNAILFLMNSLSKTRYNWRLEDCLVDLIIKSRGSFNPLLELFLTKTFPVENSVNFLSTSIFITELIERDYPILARNSYGQILTKYEIEKHTSDKKDEGIFLKLSSKLKNYGIEALKTETAPSEIKSTDLFQNPAPKPLVEIINKLIKPDPISNLDPEELTIYLQQNELNDELINSLIFYFQTKTELNDTIKSAIRNIVMKDKWGRGHLNERTKIIFISNSTCYQYFSICRFIYEKGGWYESLVNQQAFIESYQTDPASTIQFLFELLNEILNSGDYNRLLSANLINTMIKIKYEKIVIIKAWSNLFNIINLRLPDQESFDWNIALYDELNMSDEERLISILFTRLKVNTSERHHQSILGILYLLKQNPSKLIKPFKRFLKSFNDYLEITQLLLLELLCYEGKEIHTELKDELIKIYPTNNFSIDYLVELIAGLPARQSLIETNKLIYPEQDEASDFYRNVNVRFEILEKMGFDLGNVFGEFRTSFSRHYEKYFELTYNPVHKRNVNIFFNSNYFLKLINTQFYYDFRNNQNPLPAQLYNLLKIDYKTLLSQQNSIYHRPTDLEQPSTIKRDFTKQKEVLINNGWVRLGHFERELFEENYARGFKEIRSFGGLVFYDIMEKDLPYSHRILNPLFIWQPELCGYKIEEYLVCSFLQLEDFFEYYKIIWLNPVLVKQLNLIVDDYLNGLLAKNEEGDIVLRYNSWFANYVGNERIDEEIPKLDGCELLIREDYFQKILNLYIDKTPYYYLLKV